jgi:hypothetical protein
MQLFALAEQAASFMQFQYQNRRCRVFVAGYWKGFQISKEFKRSELKL